MRLSCIRGRGSNVYYGLLVWGVIGCRALRADTADILRAVDLMQDGKPLFSMAHPSAPWWRRAIAWFIPARFNELSLEEMEIVVERSNPDRPRKEINELWKELGIDSEKA